MPFTEHRYNNSPYLIQSEVTAEKLRLFKKKQRVCSVDVVACSPTEARVFDLTMIHPHDFTARMFRDIRVHLKARGFKIGHFERLLPNGEFEIRPYVL